MQAEVGGSALFASRFRECAARALLLPRRNPTRRTPLWQQRQRSAQLLSVASQYGSFPVVLETMREVLQDVFDVPGLVGLMSDVEARRVRLVEVETSQPSPFARSLLFGYIGAFMYEGDAPLAERRAQALSLDSALLAELLGQAELRELIDADALAEVEAEVQRLTPSGAPRTSRASPTCCACSATSRPPRSSRAAASRPGWSSSRRRAAPCACASRARSAGSPSRTPAACATRSAPRCPSASPRPSSSRSRTRSATSCRASPAPTGRSTPADVATRFGLGTAVVDAALARLSTSGRVVHGEFRPGGTGLEWCDAEVLRSLRRRSLAKLRKEVEPVPPDALARFLPQWQGGRRSAHAAAPTRCCAPSSSCRARPSRRPRSRRSCCRRA